MRDPHPVVPDPLHFLRNGIDLPARLVLPKQGPRRHQRCVKALKHGEVHRKVPGQACRQGETDLFFFVRRNIQQFRIDGR